MKKVIFAVGFVMFLFVSLAGIANNPNFNVIQNQNPQVHVNLTHQAEYIYSITSFNQTNSQYFSTEGNDTLTLLDGNYNSIYTFATDANGAFPAGFSGSGVQVQSELGNHSKIAKITAAYGWMRNDFYNRNNGTIEFWLYCDSNTPSIYSIAFQTGTYGESYMGIEVVYYYGVAQRGLYCNNGSSSIKLGDFALDTWIHSTYTFNCTSKTYDIWINTTYMGHVFMDYALGCNWTDFARFESGYTNRAYVDALDYSWAPDYVEGRNLNNTYYSDGSYVSPITDLGEYNNYLVQYINLSYITPDDSDIAGYVQISTDNITWSGWIPLIGLPNVTAGFEAGRYCQFYINLTASTDFLDSPSLYSLLIQFEETILNEVPSFQNIAPANNSLGLGINVPINCTVIDPDGDLLNISLYVNDTLVNAASNCENGSLFYYLFEGNYSTVYSFYFNCTDGENTTVSDTYVFTTGDESEEPLVETPALDIYLVLTIVLAFLGAFVVGGIMFHRSTEETEIREHPKSRLTHFITLLFSLFFMGCGGRSTYSPSGCWFKTPAKNNNNWVV